MKRYIKPTVVAIKIDNTELMNNLSSEGLEGTGKGGNTGENGITEGDAKQGFLDWD